jgi:hypothetical protein
MTYFSIDFLQGNINKTQILVHLGFLNYKRNYCSSVGVLILFEVADLTSSGLSSPFKWLASLIQPY